MAKLVLYNENDSTTQIVSQNERENLLFKLPNTGGTLLTEESGGLSTLVHVDNPQMVPSDNEQRGSYMYVITQEDAKNLIITGVYKNSTSGLDSVPFYYNVNGNKLTIYSDTQNIARISYSTAIRAEAQPGTGGVLPNEDVTWTGNHTFRKPVKVADGSEPEHVVNFKTGDERYSKLLSNKLTWIIGPGGDFEELDDAIREIYKYSKSNRDVTLRIRNGYTITKPTVLYNLPLSVNIVGENRKSDELIIDLNNTSWQQFGLYTAMTEVHIFDITVKATSPNNTLIYMSTGTNGSIYNADLVGMSLTTVAAFSSGNIDLYDLNIRNSYSGTEQCFDLSVSNAMVQLHNNVKFLSNNSEKLVAVRSASNGKIGSVWWASGVSISGNYKVGLQVDGGGIIDNPNITIDGTCGTKYSQTPGQWTPSGYISSNL